MVFQTQKVDAPRALVQQRIHPGMEDLAFKSATELGSLIGAGEADPLEMTHIYLARAEGVGRTLNCFITLCSDLAIAEAASASERARMRRRLGPIDGIPVAIKDNIDLAGVPTSNGIGGPAYRIPETDSEVVRRLRAAGAIILGKLNMHEGALGATSDNPHFGRVTNPYRGGHSPGGSSGGSGAAVAAGLCCAALGSDTGGSVRIPASYCGVVGLKPSYGLISTRGVVPLSYRLDHVGPLTRTVGDAALMLKALAGFDPECPESRHGPPLDGALPGAGRLDGLKIGILANFDGETQEPGIAAAFGQAQSVFRRLGADIRRVRLPSYDVIKGRRAGFVRVEVEAAFTHAALRQSEPERFSPQMRGYIDYGAKVAATQLMRSDRQIDIAAFELNQCLEEVDAIISPTTPQAAPAFGTANDDAGAYCIVANFAGAPAISVPMGEAQGMPLGLQIICASHHEARLLRIAAAFEAEAGLHLLPPPPIGPAPGQT
jgi:aspartyl-tRNA(Asn)/glutamyl-tRNA(Gln) amidotransferase subunit A